MLHSMKQKLFALLAFISLSLSIKATTYYSLTNWYSENSVSGVWSTTSGGASCNCTPNFATDTLYISHDIYFRNGVSLTTGYMIVQNGATVTMGQWGGTFSAASTASILIEEGGEISTLVGFENSGDVTVDGLLDIRNSGSGTLTNDGNITVTATGEISGQTPNVSIVNNSGGVITVLSDGMLDIGGITNNSGASIYIYGTVDQRTSWNELNNSGYIYVDGYIEAGEIYNSGTIEGYGIIERTSNSSSNTGTINGCSTCSFSSTTYLSDVPVADSRVYNNGWIGGIAPDASYDAVILSDYDSVAITCKDLYVSSYVTANVQSGTSWEVAGSIENNGTITVENTASLIQTAAADSNSGSGTFQIIRNSGTVVDNTYYNYWSSPLSDAAIDEVFSSSNTNDFYTYTSGAWSSASGSMSSGIGYATTSDINASYPTSFDRTFSGSDLNNSTVTVNSLSGSYVLLGNPYPSGVSATDFATANTNVGTFYFWDHNTSQTVYGTNVPSDYASYISGSGGTAASTGSTTPTGNIASCQGFFVELLSGSSVTFENNQRVSTNDQFFTPGVEERSRFWLNVTNDNEDFNQLLVCLSDNATDGFDRLFDGKKLKGNPNIAFYSKLNGEDYAIQGISKPAVNDVKVIPLGVDVGVVAQYTISLDSLNNWPEDYHLILVDKATNTTTNLLQTDYTFTVNQTGTISDRFYINVSKGTATTDATTTGSETDDEGDATTGVDDIDNNLENVKVYQAQNQLWIDATNSNINLEKAELVTINGQVIYTTSVNSNRESIATDNLASGVYFVRMHTAEGATNNKKVFIK